MNKLLLKLIYCKKATDIWKRSPNFAAYIDAAAEDHADKDDERPNIYFTYSCLSSADL